MGLLAASLSPLWFTWCYFCCNRLSNCTQNTILGVASLPRKGYDILQGFLSQSLRSQTSFDVEDRLCELLKAFASLLWVAPCNFCWGWLSNCTHNTRFGVPSEQGKYIICCNKRYTLLLKCLISSLRYIRKVRGASDPIHLPLMSTLYHFCCGGLSNFTQKYQIWGTLFALEFGSYEMRRDRHCSWSDS